MFNKHVIIIQKITRKLKIYYKIGDNINTNKLIKDVLLC
jgi:hypothetical protein